MPKAYTPFEPAVEYVIAPESVPEIDAPFPPAAPAVPLADESEKALVALPALPDEPPEPISIV